MPTETVKTFISSSTRHVIDACLDAYKLCRETSAYAVQRGGRLAELERIQHLHDCADVSLTMANLLTRDSRFRRDLAPLCATIARACAESLESMEHEEPQIRATYAACCHVADACTMLSNEASPAVADARDVALADTFPASDPPPPPTHF